MTKKSKHPEPQGSKVIYAFNCFRGCYEQKKCMATGGLVGIYDAEQAGMDATLGPWIVQCEAHQTTVNCGSLALAKSNATNPTLWCRHCAGKKATAQRTALSLAEKMAP